MRFNIIPQPLPAKSALLRAIAVLDAAFVLQQVVGQILDRVLGSLLGKRL